MSLTLEKNTGGNTSFRISSIGEIIIYRIYSINLDGTYNTIINKKINIKDSFIDINITPYDKIIVIYDKIINSSSLLIENINKQLSSFYSIFFKSKTPLSKNDIFIVPIIENKESLSISMALSILYKDQSLEFEIPLEGEYIASSSYNGIPVVNNFYTEKDKIENQNFSIYKAENLIYENEDFRIDRTRIINKNKNIFDILIEIRVFSIDGSIKESPIVKGILIKEYTNETITSF